MKVVNSKYYHSSSITRATTEALSHFNNRFLERETLEK